MNGKKYFLLVVLILLIINDCNCRNLNNKREIEKLDKSLVRKYVNGIWGRIGKKDLSQMEDDDLPKKWLMKKKKQIRRKKENNSF